MTGGTTTDLRTLELVVMNTVYVLFGGVMLLTLIGYTIAMTLKDILAELRLLREGQNTTTPKDTP